MKRKILIAALILAVAGVCWGAPDSGAPTATTSSATVTMDEAYRVVLIKNECSVDLYVRVFSGSETAAAITASVANGVVTIPAGASQTWYYDSAEGGIGYVSFSHITASSTCAFEWNAK